MRTRTFDALTNGEITSYLRGSSDLMFLPVGTVEMHGEMPVGAEYVLALAFAERFAEEADGLVLPHLAYFYPGATAIGRGTITISPSAGAAYLKELCRSLQSQGFRRLVFLSAHGPAHVMLSSVVREVFEELRCAALYLDLLACFGEADFDLLVWGAYQSLGRLDEIPTDQKPSNRLPAPEALSKVQRPGVQVGYYYADESQHGWWPPEPLTPEQRQERARAGLAQFEAVVGAISIRGLVEGLREVDKYIQHHVLPKHGERLP